MTRREKRNIAIGLAFISPWLIGFLVFSLYPIAAGFYYSFCHYNIVRPPPAPPRAAPSRGETRRTPGGPVHHPGSVPAPHPSGLPPLA